MEKNIRKTRSEILPKWKRENTLSTVALKLSLLYLSVHKDSYRLSFARSHITRAPTNVQQALIIKAFTKHILSAVCSRQNYSHIYISTVWGGWYIFAPTLTFIIIYYMHSHINVQTVNHILPRPIAAAGWHVYDAFFYNMHGALSHRFSTCMRYLATHP